MVYLKYTMIHDEQNAIRREKWEEGINMTGVAWHSDGQVWSNHDKMAEGAKQEQARG
jgi:hypothetical protein